MSSNTVELEQDLAERHCLMASHGFDGGCLRDGIPVRGKETGEGVLEATYGRHKNAGVSIQVCWRRQVGCCLRSRCYLHGGVALATVMPFD